MCLFMKPEQLCYARRGYLLLNKWKIQCITSSRTIALWSLRFPNILLKQDSSVSFASLKNISGGVHLSRFCRNTTGTERYFSTSQRLCLELENGQTHDEFDKNFWEQRNEGKASEKHKRSIDRIFDSRLWFKNSLVEFRTFYFVMVKDGTMFKHFEDRSDLTSAFSDPSVLATSHVSMYQKNPIVIPYRHCSHEEWNQLMSPLLETYSMSLTLNGFMQFVLLRRAHNSKVDCSIDAGAHLDSALVQSYLDFILSDPVVYYSQRALMNYLDYCRSNDRKDLLQDAYGKAKAKVKIFSPSFMMECVTCLRDTDYSKDIYHYSDILRHWCKVNEKATLVDCALAALRDKDYKSAFAWVKRVMDPSTHVQFQPNIDRFICAMLEEFPYTSDPVQWKVNREVVESFFSLMALFKSFPSSGGAECIDNWFNSIKDESWESGHYESFEIRSNRCPFSGVPLHTKKLTDEEYDYLGKVILKEVLQKTHQVDIHGRPTAMGFMHSDQRELRSFLSMLHYFGPFDLVVDGLNMFYLLQNMGKSRYQTPGPEVAAAWLRHLVSIREKKLGRKLNVLVVSRLHMRKKVQGLMEDFATVWYTSDDSSDDPYFLYAAILGGKDCKLLTLDQLRDLHHFIGKRFDYLTVKLLYKWQQIHQDLVLLGRARRLKPQKFDISIQRSQKTWHFPYYERSNIPSRWLMLKNVSN